MGVSFQVTMFILGFVVMGIFWEVILLTGSILNKYIPINERPEIRITTQVIISFVFSSILGSVLNVVAIIYYDVNWELVFGQLNPTAHLFNLLIATVFNLLYFGNYYFTEWKENLLKTEGLQREQAEVRYNALRNQLNPHFLFNALTSLNSLIFENQQLASDFLKQLSKVYRYTLQNQHNEVVALKKEIEFVEHYISLLKTRFGDAIDIKITIDQKSQERSIVPVTTQMMIENAVKHNVISSTKPLQIEFKTDDEYLIIQNTVNRKLQIETSNKLGLKNLQALYQYLSPNPIQIIEKADLYTIKIPLI